MNVLYALFISIAFTLLALVLLAGLLISSTLWLGQFLNAPPRKHSLPRPPHRAKFSPLAPLRGFFHRSLTSAKALLPTGDKTRTGIPAPDAPAADTARDIQETAASSKDTVGDEEISAIPEAVTEEPQTPDTVEEVATPAMRDNTPPPAREPAQALPKPSYGEAAVATLKIKQVTLGTGAYLRRREKLRKAADKADNPPARQEAPATVQALPVRHRSILFARGLSDLSQVHPYSRCRAPSLPGLANPDPAAL